MRSDIFAQVPLRQDTPRAEQEDRRPYNGGRGRSGFCSASLLFPSERASASMHRLRLLPSLILVFALLGIVLSVAHAAPRTIVELNTGWQFRLRAPEGSAQPEWREATVPGDVHLDLLKNKLIP